jgi:hypothetical protein
MSGVDFDPQTPTPTCRCDRELRRRRCHGPACVDRRRAAERPDRQQVEQAGRRRIGWLGEGRIHPAGANLIALEGFVPPVEAAEPDVSRDRAAEMTTRSAAGRRAMADPAARRLRLGSRAIRTAPRRHARMVAATGPRVTGFGHDVEHPAESGLLLDRDHGPVGRIAEVRAVDDGGDRTLAGRRSLRDGRRERGTAGTRRRQGR